MLLRRFYPALLLPFLLIWVGTLGYCLIEQVSVFDSLYMTVITLTTVGFQEVFPLSITGRWLTMFLSLGGVFTFFYSATVIISAVVSGEVRGLLGKRYMERNLERIGNHLIICGYGRMGRLVCHEISKQGLPFVVIERHEELLKDFAVPHGIALVGDAASDEVLRQAGIERARALITVVASDPENLYITMSARLLNEKMFIVARAEETNCEKKLLRAGANRVVSPYHIGGLRVAQAAIRPTVTDFIELATRTEHVDLQIEEMQIQSASRLSGATLKDSRIRKDHGVIIVAIKKDNGKMMFNPPSETILENGDTLVAIGDRPQLTLLAKLAGIDRQPLSRA